VAVDPNGNAVISWESYELGTSCFGNSGCPRVQGRARSVTGTLSPIQTLSTVGFPVENGSVAVDANGNAVFGWTRGNGCCLLVAEIRARSAAGTLGPVQTPAPPDYSFFGDTLCCHQSAPVNLYGTESIAFDPNGNAILGWALNDLTEGCNERGCNRAQTRVRSPAGSFSPVQTLSAANQTATVSTSPLIAVDPNGNAVFAWLVGAPGCEFPCDQVQARVRYADGTLSGAPILSAATDPYLGTELGGLGVDQNGNAVFIWSRFDQSACGGQGCFRIQDRARAANGTLSATQTLSPADRHALHPDIGVDLSGNAVMIWQRRGGGTGCGGSPCNLIETRSRSAAGVLSSAQILSALGQNAEFPHVAITSSGKAIAVWRRFNGTNWIVQAASGP
jgi:hypothetical protein